MSESVGARVPTVHEDGKIFRIHYYSVGDKGSILRHMYGKSKVHLQRKYDLVRKFCRPFP
jgi:hypothetical protein